MKIITAKKMNFSLLNGKRYAFDSVSGFFHSANFIKSCALITFASALYVLFFIFPRWTDGLQDNTSAVQDSVIIIFTFFMISFFIAIISVMAGIGGGILFTPIMMAFSSIDANIIKTTGLIVAMFSGLISSGPLMKSGLANLRLCLLLTLPFTIGGISGANFSIHIADDYGIFGEALMRFLLSILLFAIALYFIFSSKKIEFPDLGVSDKLTEFFDLRLPFHEKSSNKILVYHISNTGKGLFLMSLVGFVSGFFGLGGGWAIVPVQNLIMSIPLKAACANSGIVIGIGDSVAIWPYIRAGGLIPLFVAPWLIGQVLGGIIGSNYLSNVRAVKIRYILIGIMLFTSFSLLVKGLLLLKIIKELQWYFYLFFFASVFSVIFYKMYAESKKEKKTAKIAESEFEPEANFTIPKPQLVYGKVVYLITAFTAFASLSGLILSFIYSSMNKQKISSILYSVISGEKHGSASSVYSGTSFISSLFEKFLLNDFILIVIIFGCLAPAIGLLCSVFYFHKEKSRLFAVISILIISLIVLSSFGIISLH